MPESVSPTRRTIVARRVCRETADRRSSAIRNAVFAIVLAAFCGAVTADDPVIVLPPVDAPLRAILQDDIIFLPPVAEEKMEFEVDEEELMGLGDNGIGPEQIEAAVLGHGDQRVEFRKRLERDTANQIQRIESAFPLTGPMRRKLEMAARGDVARFYEDLQRLTQQFGPQRKAIDDMQKLQQECMELSIRGSNSLHGSESLFQKTFRSLLQPEQKNRLEVAARKAVRKQHTERIEKLFAEIDRTLSLKAVQREKLHELFARRIKPPKVTGLEFLERLEAPETEGDWPLEFLRSLAEIPDEEYQQIVTERQWPGLNTIIGRYRKRAERLERLDAVPPP
jgi:hypothetical protein